MKKSTDQLIFMRGMKSSDLQHIINFLYNGEVNIYQEHLNDFLAIAEDLQLKGLAQSENPPDQNIKYEVIEEKSETEPKMNRRVTRLPNPVFLADQQNVPNDLETEGTLISTSLVTLNDNDLKQKMAELVKWNSEINLWECLICGKQAPNTKNLKTHTQIHMEGLVYPCNVCGKTFRCSTNLKNHKYSSKECRV